MTTMMFDRTNDFDLRRRVRAELVRHAINPARVDVFVTRSWAEVRGEVVFQGAGAAPTADDMPARLRLLEKGLKGVSGLKGVHWRLSGWTKTGEAWSRKDGAGTAA